MELLRTIRERHEASRQQTARRHAEEYITIEDFEGKLFIAIDGIPAILFDDNATMAEMVQKLEDLRNNYVNYITRCQERN